MDTPGTPAAEQPEDLCETVLKALAEALRHPSTGLNARFNVPQRMRVTGAEVGPLRHEGADRCSVPLRIAVAEVTLAYTLAVDLRAGEAVLRDDGDFEERIRLSAPSWPLQAREIQALYDVLAADIAAHFGADS